MATNNSVNTPLSGSTGTGNFVGSTSPTLVTPTLGAATATSFAFSPTTGGIIGTTAADNVTAGDVGEFVSSTVALGSAVSLSNNTSANITSISLTAGDWDVSGNVFFGPSIGVTNISVWISSTSVTQPDPSLYNAMSTTTAIITGSGIQAPSVRINVSGTTTVYISVKALFSSGTCTGCGGIFARRRR